MSSERYWCGFLEAGDRSTAVLRDEHLDTGNPQTIYLFSLGRRRIAEYRRDIVESKLRALSPSEASLQAELEAAYRDARREFRAQGQRLSNLPERGPGPAQQRPGDDAPDPAEALDELADSDMDDGGDEEDWDDAED